MTLAVDDRERTIVWRGLRADAHANPHVLEVQELRAAHDELRALFEHPGLARIR
jgi:hypothetical protein